MSEVKIVRYTESKRRVRERERVDRLRMEEIEENRSRAGDMDEERGYHR